MAYCGTEEIISSTGVLSNIGTTVIGTNLVSDHIERADNIINGKLARAYIVPFGSGTLTPPLINTISIDLSAYFVMRHLYTKDAVNDSEWADKYKMYMEDGGILDQIAKGDMAIIDISGDLIVKRG